MLTLVRCSYEPDLCNAFDLYSIGIVFVVCPDAGTMGNAGQFLYDDGAKGKLFVSIHYLCAVKFRELSASDTSGHVPAPPACGDAFRCDAIIPPKQLPNDAVYWAVVSDVDCIALSVRRRHRLPAYGSGA